MKVSTLRSLWRWKDWRLKSSTVCSSYTWAPSHCAKRANSLVIQELHRKIHDYANLANRTAPLASDMYDICQESELETEDLRLTSELSKLRRRGALN